MQARGSEPELQSRRDSGHIVENQEEIAGFLAAPRSHGPGVKGVQRIDTHGAMVFLAGERVYKVKRAVRYPYMDFSTLERRRRACEREVALNRRTAPTLYLGVEAIVRDANGALALGGPGRAVEWAVVMRRFAQAALLDRRAEAGTLTLETIVAVADAIAAFHAAAPPLTDDARRGGAAAIRWVIQENAGEFDERADLFAVGAAARLEQGGLEELERRARLLDARRGDGRVRQCHGDLHLRNICLLEGAPTLFDAIEFNDALACIDVLYDLAFLLMDLEHRGLHGLANLALNRYLERTGDDAGLAALPLFLSCRAAVRAKTSASAEAGQEDHGAARHLRDEARSYFDAARLYLLPPPARLVAVGGLAGTGKTSVARRLAPDLGAAPGALHLRSDAVRKALFGVEEQTRLPEEAYRPEQSGRVYAALAARARAALEAGHSAIVDAVFAKAGERDSFEALARETGARFDGVWLEARPETLIERVDGRTGDASDATAAVVREQLAYDLGPLSWRRVDVGRGLDEVAAAVARALGQ